jgi:hypothetical protein
MHGICLRAASTSVARLRYHHGVLLTRFELTLCAIGACILAVAPALVPRSEAFADQSRLAYHPKPTKAPSQVASSDPEIKPDVQGAGRADEPQGVEPQGAADLFRAVLTASPGLNSLPGDAGGWSPWAPLSAQKAATMDKPSGSPESSALQSTPPLGLPVATERVRSLRNRSDVREIQARLAKLGYLSAVPTGEWRTLSQEALRRFKKDQHLAPDADWDHVAEQALFAPGWATNQFVGVWAPDASACLPEMNRNGLLTTLISERGARAGGTTCSFQKSFRRSNVWLVSASCSDGREHWHSRVQLVRMRDSLLWASAKGARSYTRCDREAVVAIAGHRRM